MDIDRKVMGRRIVELRGDLGLTQEDVLARLAANGEPLSQAGLSHLENGRRLPSLTVLLGLTQVLQTSADYLLGLTENPLTVADIEDELASGGVTGDLGRLWGNLSPSRRGQVIDYVRYVLWQQAQGDDPNSDLIALRAVLNVLERRIDPDAFAALLRDLAREFPTLGGGLARSA